jgi:hypothetical protein
VAARLIVALVLSGCLGATTRTPTGVVERFYAARIDSQMSGAPTAEELESVAPYLTPELQELLADARRLRDGEAAATPDEKPAFADGDLFSSLFEGPTAFRVVRDQAQGDVHHVRVRFVYAREPETVSWEDSVVVVPQGQSWAIADVEYAGDWDFASRGTLQANLRRALARPRAACQALVPSTWVVRGHGAPGVSAMSAGEANAWNGAVLTIGRDRMAFRDDVCASPTFTAKEMTRAEFAEEFRVSADALGLAPGPICVTNVACVDDTPMPGSLLVHGRGELLLLWDGVWFRAARRRE